MKKLISYFFLGSILVLAAFVRLYRLTELTVYGAETAQHYLEIKKLLEGQLLLNGLPTSHQWLRLSPTFYYLFFPILLLTKFHPLTNAYFGVLVSIFSIFLNYWIIKKVFDNRTALISTLFIAFSPALLSFNYFNLIIPLIYLLLFFTHKIIKRKKKIIWPVFLLIGLMATLHASALSLLLLFIGLFFYLKKFTPSQTLKSLLAFIVPNTLFIFSDFKHGFYMTRSLILWIPYKIVNFFMGRTLGVGRNLVPDETWINILKFFQLSFFPANFPIILGFIIVCLLIFYFLFSRLDFFERVLYFWLFFGILVLIIHRNPPFHYFIPIFILPPILISHILAKNLNNKIDRLLAPAIIFFILFSNMIFIFSSQFLFRESKTNPPFIPYQIQERIARVIIADAQGRKYSLSRIGPFDHYVNEFKENYQYLLWWLGNEPVKKSNLNYLIVEEKNKLPKDFKTNKIGEVDGVVVYRVSNY